ncbi:Rossmann fold domain-containing protein [Gemmobacter sp.]|uniref:Rossmann fold domain-containing protein n=1 Tax=Gemmobacter sp. TaxID=1898957 RepID=UPI002B003B7B|nr:hypothetical protein [Gemmobacter sp.]
MAQAVITGGGPLASLGAEVLAGLGWRVRRLVPGDDGLSGDETLLLAMAPSVTDGSVARLAQAMADQLPPAARDGDGEMRAPGQVVLLLDSAAQVPGLGPVEPAVAQAAALRWLADAALALAPRLRVNALTCNPSIGAADLAPVLAWLTTAHAVTGQALTLGPVPRLASPWRGDTSRPGHFT